MIAVPSEAPVAIEIAHDHGLWRFRSADGRLYGAFVDQRAAVRAARDEADGHASYVVVNAPTPV